MLNAIIRFCLYQKMRWIISVNGIHFVPVLCHDNPGRAVRASQALSRINKLRIINRHRMFESHSLRQSVWVEENQPALSENRLKSVQFRNFLPQTKPEKMSRFSPASFPAIFSAGHGGSPVSPRTSSSITTRCFGESDLTSSNFGGEIANSTAEL